MSAPRLFGRAVVYALGGATVAMYGETLSYRIIQSETFTRGLNVNTLYSQNNEPEGFQTTQQRKEVSIEFVPVGTGSASSTVADAKTVLSSSLAANVTKVTLSGQLQSSLDGTYLYLGGATVRASYDNYAIVSMNLVSWDDADNSFLSTLVTG